MPSDQPEKRNRKPLKRKTRYPSRDGRKSDRERLEDDQATFARVQAWQQEYAALEAAEAAKKNRRKLKNHTVMSYYQLTPSILLELQKHTAFGAWCAYSVAVSKIGQLVDSSVLRQVVSELSTIYNVRYGAVMLTFESLEDGGTVTAPNDISDADQAALANAIASISTVLRSDPSVVAQASRMADQAISFEQLEQINIGWRQVMYNHHRIMQRQQNTQN